MTASRRWAGVLLAAGLALSACGGGAAAVSTAAAASPTPELTLPPCASEAPIAIPETFPRNVPLPPGAVVTVAEATGSDVVVQLLVPLSIAELGAFLEREFSLAGLTLGDGEAEPDELEQAFSGSGIAGQITARHSGDCEDALNVRIAVRST